VIQRGVFSSASDVWSFGVLLWELFSKASHPYVGMTNAEATEKVIDGYRLSQPKQCPPEIYEIMVDCWQEKPDKRPTFLDIFQRLQGKDPKAISSIKISDQKADKPDTSSDTNPTDDVVYSNIK
jgi:hypothetical protein